MTDFDLTVQWTVAGLIALVMLWRGQMTLFHPATVYLAFHVIVFCLRPTMVHYFDFDFVFRYMELTPKSEDLQLALMLSSAGLVAFYLAFTIVTMRARPLKFGRKRALNDLDRRAFLYTAAIFGPLGIFSIIAARPKGEMVNGVFIMTGTSGYLNDLQNVLIPVCIVFILVSHWRWWSYLPFLAYLFYRMNQGWGRWTFVLSCFLLVLLWLWDHRKRFPPLRFIVPAPFLLMLFLYMSHDRMFFHNWISGERSANVEAANAADDWRAKWDTLDFANYDFLTYIVTFVPRKTKTYTYGTQYLQLFTEPIPRRLWKGKPVGPPVQFFDLNDYGNFIGLTNSLVGDGWLSGGWFGAMLTMSIAGSALGFAYRWFTRNQEVAYKACAFLIINAMSVQLFRDGGISIFKFLLFALVPLFVWAFLSHRLRAEEEILGEREALKESRFARFAAADQGFATGAALAPPGNRATEVDEGEADEMAEDEPDDLEDEDDMDEDWDEADEEDDDEDEDDFPDEYDEDEVDDEELDDTAYLDEESVEDEDEPGDGARRRRPPDRA